MLYWPMASPGSPFLGELSMSGMHSFSEFENVLLKRKVDEKKQSTIKQFFKKND